LHMIFKKRLSHHEQEQESTSVCDAGEMSKYQVLQQVRVFGIHRRRRCLQQITTL
jgi:hypothetical protein